MILDYVVGRRKVEECSQIILTRECSFDSDRDGFVCSHFVSYRFLKLLELNTYVQLENILWFKFGNFTPIGERVARTRTENAARYERIHMQPHVVKGGGCEMFALLRDVGEQVKSTRSLRICITFEILYGFCLILSTSSASYHAISVDRLE